MSKFDELKDIARQTVDTILVKSTELYETAEEKAKYLARSTKLKADISKENAEIKKAYADLGSLYYCMHKDDPEDALAQLCGEIKSLVEKIEIRQHELYIMQAEAAEKDIEIEIIEASECDKDECNCDSAPEAVTYNDEEEPAPCECCSDPDKDK